MGAIPCRRSHERSPGPSRSLLPSQAGKAKILLWDLETTNLSANFGYLLCFGYKWLGEKKPNVISITDFPAFKTDPTNDYFVVREAAKVLSDANIWVTWYGKRFDSPYINARLLYHNLPFLPPVPHVDGWRVARDKLRLNSNRLASVQAFLGLPTEKTVLSGPIWVRAAAGHRPSIDYVKEHCLADVEVLEQAYNRIKPLMTTHPNLAVIEGKLEACPICSGAKLQRRGFYITRTRRYQRLQCQSCGGWSRETMQMGRALVS